MDALTEYGGLSVNLPMLYLRPSKQNAKLWQDFQTFLCQSCFWGCLEGMGFRVQILGYILDFAP